MALFDNKQKNNITVYQKSIEEKNVAITKRYDEIGRLYYNQYKDNNCDVTKQINQKCEDVTRLYTEIEDLKVKILFERGLKICPSCGSEIPLEYAFCFKCGAKFPEGSANAPASVLSSMPAATTLAVNPAAPADAPAEEGEAPAEA